MDKGLEKRHYIAYGSNLNIEQMRYRCPDATIVGTTTLKDHRLLFMGSHSGFYLTVEPMAGASVPAAVWAVTESDEAMLDRYEGYPNSYTKKAMTVRVKSARTGRMLTRRAFIYVMRSRRGMGLPTPLYFRVCSEGYRSFGFDRQKLIDACIASAIEKENPNEEQGK